MSVASLIMAPWGFPVPYRTVEASPVISRWHSLYRVLSDLERVGWGGDRMTRGRIARLVIPAFLILFAGCGFFDDPQQPKQHPCSEGWCDISGYVLDFQGNPLSNIRVTRTGEGGGYALTDAQGYYKVTRNVPGWRYCVAPEHPEWVFDPEKRCHNMEKHYKDQNFTGWPVEIVEYYISGRVVDGSGEPVEGALITTEGHPESPVRTDADGQYRVENIIGGFRYCVIPSMPKCTFFPEKRLYQELETNYIYQNFEATCE